jgi:3-oxoacyl-[acyl-carrier protein] reductase
MFNLTGKVALVTGASSGMGHAIALALATQGASVVAAARRLERLMELEKTNSRIKACHMDVTKRSDVDAAVAVAVQTFGKLDILVNNAGILDYSPFFDLTEESWDKVIDTNLKGYFYCAQTAAREMIKKNPPVGGGRIINIASIGSGGVGVGFPMIVHYCASKGGVIGLTEALAHELGPMGITVNAVGPGAIETEMTQGTTDEQKKGMTARLPIKRMGTAEEIAAAVVYFASNEAAYTTGATLYVDGGWLAT